MRFLRAFGQFWYDFLIGDDWKIFAAVVGVLTLTLVLLLAGLDHDALAIAFVAFLSLTFAGALLLDVRKGPHP